MQPGFNRRKKVPRARGTARRRLAPAGPRSRCFGVAVRGITVGFGCHRHNPASYRPPYCDPALDYGRWDPPTGAAVAPSVAPPTREATGTGTGGEGSAPVWSTCLKPSGGAGCSRSWNLMLLGSERLQGGCRCNQGATDEKRCPRRWYRAPSAGSRRSAVTLLRRRRSRVHSRGSGVIDITRRRAGPVEPIGAPNSLLCPHFLRHGSVSRRNP